MGFADEILKAVSKVQKRRKRTELELKRKRAKERIWRLKFFKEHGIKYETWRNRRIAKNLPLVKQSSKQTRTSTKWRNRNKKKHLNLDKRDF